MKKTVILATGILFSIFLIAATLTSIDDFFMPGSQPGQSGNIEHPNKCDNCHGGYDKAVEPAFNWRGSMMAQAARDPLFYACLAIAEQDAPGSGDLCIRCHAPDGWLNGRSTPTDGSALNNNDREGVQCDFCHKLVKPSDVGINPYADDPDYSADTWPSDQDYLGTLTMIPPQSGNGMYVAHDANAKRGPFVDAAAKHQMFYSPFHSESDICGTCHDVSNPYFDAEGNIASGGIDKGKDAFKTSNMLPVERTFSEWKVSEYATIGVSGTPFGGNKETVSSCQDCHMRDVSGYGANKKNIPYRDDLPLHDMTGGNTFIPDLVAQLYPDEVDLEALNAGKERALFMLQNAATMNLSVSESSNGLTADVEVINETGHKLPSGYPEGRRIWIQLQAYDSNGNMVYESGAYDPETAVLTQTGTKIYEIKLGMAQNVLDATGLSNYEDGSSFHFVLNNNVVKDNRIPPRGFTNANFEAIQSPVVGYQYADKQYGDNTSYSLPSGTERVVARLLYQTVSKEYIEFLRDENITNDAGNILYQLWSDNGKSAPVVMNEAEYLVSGSTAEPVAAFSASPESGEAPLTVQFNNESINADSYLWDFAGEATSTEENPIYEFTAAGSYTVTLTATNSASGSSDTAIKTIEVTESTTPQPIVSVSGVQFTRGNDPKGDKTYVLATVSVADASGNPVSGALVYADFSGPTNGSVSGYTAGDGTITFESRSVKTKNAASEWCLTITSIEITGYTFEGPATWCESGQKSAFIVSKEQSVPHVNVYPNPFSDKLFFEFSHTEDCHANLEIYDATGKKLQTLFDRNIKTGELYKVQYSAEKATSGLMFYKIRMGNATFDGKLIYNK